MHKRLKNFLDEPFTLFLSYPLGHLYFGLLIIVSTVLINLFQPFGLNNWNETHKWLVIYGYVMIYAGIYWLIFMICLHLFPEYYSPHCWTRLKEYRVLMVYVPLASIASWIYSKFAIIELDRTYLTFFRIQSYTGIMGVFIVLVFKYMVFPKIKSTFPPMGAIARLITPEHAINMEGYITVKAQKIAVNELIYVESMKNYLYIHLLRKGRMIEIVERCTMKEFVTSINAYPQFLHCFESFVVNLNDIASWYMSGQNMKIQLKSCTKIISVSRNKQAFMKEIFKTHLILKQNKSC